MNVAPRVPVAKTAGYLSKLVQAFGREGRFMSADTGPLWAQLKGVVVHDRLTFDLAEAAERIGGVSERWLAAQLRAGAIPGRKVGRKWRMTAGDIDACLDIFKIGPECSTRQRSHRAEADGQERFRRSTRRDPQHPTNIGQRGRKEDQFLLFD